MTVYADLHIHTSCSDGQKTASEVVDQALSRQLKVIAISDHDTLVGVPNAIEYAQNKLRIIPAVEMSTQFENEDLHVLGYFNHFPGEDFNRQLNKCALARNERAILMAKKLGEIGIMITESEIRKVAGEGVVGRPHLAHILCSKGIVSNLNEAFERYLGEHTPYYVSKYQMTPQEAFQLIRDAGGLPVWAHPGTVNRMDLVEMFVRDGLSGLEVYHPKHSKNQIKSLLQLCQQFKLLVTGGTDFHSDDSIIRIGDVGIEGEDYLLFMKAIDTLA